MSQQAALSPLWDLCLFLKSKHVSLVQKSTRLYNCNLWNCSVSPTNSFFRKYVWCVRVCVCRAILMWVCTVLMCVGSQGGSGVITGLWSVPTEMAYECTVCNSQVFFLALMLVQVQSLLCNLYPSHHLGFIILLLLFYAVKNVGCFLSLCHLCSLFLYFFLHLVKFISFFLHGAGNPVVALHHCRMECSCVYIYIISHFLWSAALRFRSNCKTWPVIGISCIWHLYVNDSFLIFRIHRMLRLTCFTASCQVYFMSCLYKQPDVICVNVQSKRHSRSNTVRDETQPCDSYCFLHHPLSVPQLC